MSAVECPVGGVSRIPRTPSGRDWRTPLYPLVGAPCRGFVQSDARMGYTGVLAPDCHCGGPSFPALSWFRLWLPLTAGSRTIPGLLVPDVDRGYHASLPIYTCPAVPVPMKGFGPCFAHLQTAVAVIGFPSCAPSHIGHDRWILSGAERIRLLRIGQHSFGAPFRCAKVFRLMDSAVTGNSCHCPGRCSSSEIGPHCGDVARIHQHL